MAELKPCPFCGSTNIDCSNYSGSYNKAWFVQCDECCAMFPMFDTKEEAIEAWNTRTTQKEG